MKNISDDIIVSVANDTDFIKRIRKIKKEFSYYASWERQQEAIFDRCQELGFDFQRVKCAINLLKSNGQRKARCHDKIGEMFRNYKTVYFGTLTFRDDVLQSTSQETRRRYVGRYMKSISERYIANIDFGDKNKNPDSNEREHYHCLIAIDKMPVAWKYGFCKFKKVRIDDGDAAALSSYIVKLSRHSLKQTKEYKAPRLIYSKCVAPGWLFE